MNQEGEKTRAAIARSKANIEAMKSQINKIDEAMSNIRAEAATADKRAEYSLSLYNKITNISWDYEGTQANSFSGCKYLFELYF